MFHTSDNLFWERVEDGGVRVVKLRAGASSYPTIDSADVLFEVTIPWNHWCSVIASMSRTGESHYNPETGKHKWHAAVDFHNS